MLRAHYDRYFSRDYRLERAPDSQGDDAPVETGALVRRNDDTRVDIRGGIPRFTGDGGYADSFGYQWKRFRETQLDSRNGRFESFCRLWTNTKWKPMELHGKTVLEAGCGAGRFAEVLLDAGATVVSFDMSDAIEVNYENNHCERLCLFQGDINALPLEEAQFDFVFCYGVLQHTPDPAQSFSSLNRFLKPGGRFSVDVYARMGTPAPWYFPKYVWRPVTTGMDRDKLLKIIRCYIPIWLPIDTLVKKVPRLGSIVAGLIPIPCFNPLGKGLSYRERLEWAVLDTFDALVARYDFPQTPHDVRLWCESPLVDESEVFFGSNGIVANGRRSEVDS